VWGLHSLGSSRKPARVHPNKKKGFETKGPFSGTSLPLKAHSLPGPRKSPNACRRLASTAPEARDFPALGRRVVQPSVPRKTYENRWQPVSGPRVTIPPAGAWFRPRKGQLDATSPPPSRRSSGGGHRARRSVHTALPAKRGRGPMAPPPNLSRPGHGSIFGPVCRWRKHSPPALGRYTKIPSSRPLSGRLTGGYYSHPPAFRCW